MKILNININIDGLKDNQQRLLDLNKSLLYSLDNDIFDKIDFDTDPFFLEPSLFYFLLDQRSAKFTSLQQICAGVRLSQLPAPIDLYFDSTGMSYISGIGEYFSEKIRDRTVMGIFDSKTKNVLIDDMDLEANSFLVSEVCDQIKFPRYIPEILISNNVLLEEGICESYEKSKKEFTKAMQFFKDHLQDFYCILKLVTKEIYIFNSRNINSFAGITYHGAAFLNTEGKIQDHIFFIEDIAHQCGHIIFNTLTLDYDDYINIPKDTQLKEIDSSSTDKRKVYGAYHGMFTYSCIMYSLTKRLETLENCSKKFSLMGRIGFFLTKFSSDVQFFARNTQIFRSKGLVLLQQFREYYDYLYIRFFDEMKNFDYSNQPYTFDEHSFLVNNKTLSK